MASNQPAAGNSGGASIMTSIDTILSRHARSMKPGETLTLTLVKGPKSQSTDPLLARAAAAKKMPNPNQMFALDFPRVAKFVETVDRPDFAGKFKEGRLIEEDVPEVKVRAYPVVCVFIVFVHVTCNVLGCSCMRCIAAEGCADISLAQFPLSR